MLEYSIPLDKAKSILVAGAAGFIGSNLVKKLLREYNVGQVVGGIDNMSNYYDVSLKEECLLKLQKTPGNRFMFIKGNIADRDFDIRGIL